MLPRAMTGREMPHSYAATLDVGIVVGVTARINESTGQWHYLDSQLGPTEVW